MDNMKKLMASLPALPAIRKTAERSAYYMELQKKLLEACQKGELETLRDLIDSPRSEPIDFNEFLNEPTGSYKWTPLMVAAYYGHRDIVYFLINNEAKIESHRYKVDMHYQTPSGATVFDFVNKANQRKHAKNGEGTEDEKVKAKEAIEAETKAIHAILTKEKTRQERLNQMPTKKGFHETSSKSFQFILQDVEKKRYPMVGGEGGYFGGGIYFAASQEESSEKALHRGYGFKCTLKMGNCLKINSEYDLMAFYMRYCYTSTRDDSYDGYYTSVSQIRAKTDSYGTPVDIMEMRLLEDGYDSVWGINDDDVPLEQRILKTGDEFVVYSADQVVIENYFAVENYTKTWKEIPHKALVEMKKFHSAFKRNWENQLNSFTDIAYAASNSYVAIGSYTGIYIWDLKNKNEISRFNVGAIITELIFSPDEKTVAVAILKKGIPSIYLIDYANKQIVKTFENKHTDQVYSLAYTPDGRYLVSAGKDGYWIFWKTEEKTDIESKPIIAAALKNKSAIIEIALTDNEFIYYDESKSISIMNYLPILAKDSYERLSNNEKLDALNIRQYQQKSLIQTLAVCSKKNIVGFVNIRGEITFLNLKTGKLIQQFLSPNDNITQIAFSPNGNYLITGSALETRVSIWNIKDFADPPFVFYSFEIDYGYNNVELLRFSKDGHELICGLKNGFISGWNVKGLLD
jgi:WD40 repeat protein